MTPSETSDSPMTLGELRAALADYPDDLPVFVDGYEDGITRPKLRYIDWSPMAPERRRPYYGEWEDTFRRGQKGLVLGR